MADQLTRMSGTVLPPECDVLVSRNELQAAELVLKDLRQYTASLQCATVGLQEAVMARRYDLERQAPLEERARTLEAELQREKARRMLAELRAEELLLTTKPKSSLQAHLPLED